MAITNFVPEVWSAALLSELRNRLVYAQPGMVNRDYEGEIANAGDTVHITNVQDVTVGAYTGNLSYQALSDDTRALVIEQKDSFAFKVDDIERRQALPGYVEEASRSAAYGLAERADRYVAESLMAADAGTVVADAANQVDLAATDAYDLLVDLRTALTRAKCPADGRWVVVPPEMYAYLLRDDRFIRADAAGTTEGLRNGVVGRAAGFTVVESNTVPETVDATNGDYFTVLAGHSMATTFAEQILKTEALRLESSFHDGIRGLHVYDGLVVRPELVASAAVTK